MCDTRRSSRSCLALWALLVAVVAATGHAQPGAPAAKNVILMIADGCGFNHVAAASLYRHGVPDGEVYQGFAVRLAVSTFPAGGSYDPAKFWQGFDYAKQGVTDSAAAATALACGVKTRNGYLGVDPQGKAVPSIVEAAEALGRSTGLLSSVPFSHATPAAFAAHEPGRGDYAEIARQMVQESGVDVILSAGHPWYDDNGRRLTRPSFGFLDEALWTSLARGTAGADANGDGRPDKWRLLQTRSQILSLLHGAPPPRVFGLAPAGSTLQEGRTSPAGQSAATAAPFAAPMNLGVPSLKRLSQAALAVLSTNPKGFFVMIEGGAVDWAAHSNLSGRAIEEQMEFGDAVAAVVQWVDRHSNWDETLLIVTADHETGCLTGPGEGWAPLVGKGKGRMPEMVWHYGSHTNSLVPLYARGAGAELLAKYADQQDPVRGAYLDNTEVNAAMRAVLR